MEGEVPSKKLRKPYTITRPRDRWTSEEHDRFLEALLLFGRDWKKIEDFVGTKTTIQASVQDPMRRSNLNDRNSNFDWAESSSQVCRNEYALMPPISNPTTSVPEMPNLCQVYSFIGNMFDPEKTRPVEIFIEMLRQLDPVTLKALLSMIRNLTEQISSPDFESLNDNGM
ncbi:Protein REVEILLE 8 [Carex littledalei]|uniref:Protein REVEILLE 8 n=1 Tax=Carex littledalei TaxID=544730 RepID=A0A833VC96_9POAL|nr:Protein REVEILLE 8 [Carex littledalei]